MTSNEMVTVLLVLSPVLCALAVRWLADAGIVRCHQGLARAKVVYNLLALAVLGFLAVAYLLDALRRAERARWEVPLATTLIVIEVVVVVLAVLKRQKENKRRKARPPAAVRIPWGEYYLLAGLLILLHVGLVVAYLWMLAQAPQELVAAGWLWVHGPLALIAFCASQLSVTWFVNCLAASLREDWLRGDGTELTRESRYLLTAAPVTVCLIPSVFMGALLVGVLGRLAVLGMGYLWTDEGPSSQLATLCRLVLRRRGPRLTVSETSQQIAGTTSLAVQVQSTDAPRDRPHPHMRNARTHEPWVRASGMSRDITKRRAWDSNPRWV
jgi:hypothetical protein